MGEGGGAAATTPEAEAERKEKEEASAAAALRCVRRRTAYARSWRSSVGGVQYETRLRVERRS